MAALNPGDVGHISDWLSRFKIAELGSAHQVALAIRWSAHVHTAVPDPHLVELYEAEAVRQWEARRSDLNRRLNEVSHGKEEPPELL